MYNIKHGDSEEKLVYAKIENIEGITIEELEEC